MPWYDLPLERLREYRTSTPEPDGLDEWWAERLEAARAQARPAKFTPHEPDVYRPYQVFDVEFAGAGGDPIRAWYIKPGGQESAPVVVKFIGYGGGRARRPSTSCCPRSVTRCSSWTAAGRAAAGPPGPRRTAGAAPARRTRWS